MRSASLQLRAVGLILLLVPTAFVRADAGSAPVFESDPVRPIALSPDGTRVFLANAPDGRLEILAVTAQGLRAVGSVPVGLEPVAVAPASDAEVWVVNHLSDSVSVVDVAAEPPRVVRTLFVGDEPRDIVFAGPGGGRAFIATAHRGQNTPFDPQAGTPGLERADVWIFDAAAPGSSLGGDPIAIVPLFGDKPRALAATPDGATVYAAIFHSGNATTTIPAEAICDGGSAAPSCLVDGLVMPGGLPAPNQNLEGTTGPETGLIARYDPVTGAWRDELGRDWRNAARFALPDRDVFAIDALADPPTGTAAVSGVGTILFGLAVNPASGVLYVANTEAINTTRLENEVQGRLHESRITIVDAGVARPRHLNKHIDYPVVPSPPGISAASLSTPLALAVTDDGGTLYVAAFGSGKIGVLDTHQLAEDSFVPDAGAHISVSGGGPSGIALDEPRGRLYVSTRFDVGVSVVDLASRTEIAHLRFHDPEPPEIRAGRSLLYDAVATSSNGEASCAGCHVFADFDGLAWDLGRTDLPVMSNPLELLQTSGRDDEEFHPLKGPMTTQTLRGMSTHGSMHWRGDRSGGNLPGGDPGDERAAFAQFNDAFVSLIGRAAPLADDELERLTDFVLALTLPPNPYARLDGSLTPAQAAGRDAFFQEDCNECHTLDPPLGFFGATGAAAVNSTSPQFMKVPQLRNLYQKIGRVFGILFEPLFDLGDLGDQVRGFGFQHDGSAGRIDDPAGDFLFVFPTGLAPIVGQQITLTDSNAATVAARIDLLIERAATFECDLVAKSVVAGEARGWLRTTAGAFESDRATEVALGDGQLRSRAAVPGQAITYTCAAPGTGTRLALDRDGDGARDRDEIDAGSDPADPASRPTGPSGVASFLLYRAASRANAFFPLGPVQLASAIDDREVDALEPFAVGLPASSAAPPAAPHFASWDAYRLRRSRDETRTTAEILRVINECADVSVRLGRRATLLLPARASEVGPVAPPLESEHDLDPLLCRTATAAGDPSAAGTHLPRGTQIELGDAFQTRRYDVVELTRVCLPAETSGQPRWLRGPRAGEPVALAPAQVRHPERAYVCYRVKRARRFVAQNGCGPALPADRGTTIRPEQPRHAHRTISVADALGSLELESRRELEACFASQVTPTAP
jgi:YVTN family beta-propeller protein